MTHIHTGPCHDDGVAARLRVVHLLERGEGAHTGWTAEEGGVAILPRDNLLCLLWCGYACPQGHESAPQAETLYETVILTGLPPAWRKRPAEGGALSTPLIGGEGGLSLCVRREWGTGRIPQPTQKNAVAQVGRQVWRATVQGYTIPVPKIMKKRGTMHKIGRKMMFFEDERYDMSEFLPKFAPVYPRRVSLSLRPMPATAKRRCAEG